MKQITQEQITNLLLFLKKQNIGVNDYENIVRMFAGLVPVVEKVADTKKKK